jgi:hypothetical protein
MKKIVFFNFWQNGDCFINKEYVRDIIQHFPEAEIDYAHKNHPNIVADLKCSHVPLESLHSQLNMWIPIAHDEEKDVVYINTWVGCWIGKYLQHGEHANFTTLPRVWKEVYDYLKIIMKDSYEYYHPQIHHEHFDNTHCIEYLNEIGHSSLIVFCNGQAMSKQSSMGNMEKIIELVADAFPKHNLFVTDRVNVDRPNVKFSDDVLKGTVGNLNQISYISRFAKLIIGKNSGPFTYAHTRANMTNPHKTFMCFSHVLEHCLMGEGEYLTNSFFSDTIDDIEAFKIISELIESPKYEAIKKNTKWL